MKTNNSATTIRLRYGFILLIIAVIWGIVNQCHGQGKCSYARNEVDKFTGNRIIETKRKTIAPYFSVAVLKINSTNYLLLGHSGLNVFSVDKGNELMILFADKSKITLNNLEYTIADGYSYSGITTWGATLRFILDDNHIKDLLSKPVSAIRIYRNDGYFDGDVKEFNKFKITESLQCAIAVKITP